MAIAASSSGAEDGPNPLSARGSYLFGYEAQIALERGTEKNYRTGSLYGLAPVSERLVPPDTWFVLEVIADGFHIVIKVNGKVSVDFVDEKKRYFKGHIAASERVPGHGGRVPQDRDQGDPA